MLNKGNHQKSLSCPFRYGWLPLRVERLWLSLSWLAHVFQLDIKSWSMFSCIWSWVISSWLFLRTLIHGMFFIHYLFFQKERPQKTELFSFFYCLLSCSQFVSLQVCVHMYVYHTLTSLQATQQVGQCQLGWASSRQLGWFLCLPCGPACLRACLCSLDSWASSRQLGLRVTQ